MAITIRFLYNFLYRTHDTQTAINSIVKSRI